MKMRTGLAVGAGAILIAGLSSSGAFAIPAYTFTISGNLGVPTITLTNDSTASERITGFNLTIGDTGYNFDIGDFPLSDWGTGIDSVTVLSPAAGGRADEIKAAFTGFDPGDDFVGYADLDIDSRDSYAPYTSVFFNNGSAPNSMLSVAFSDDTVLEWTLLDGSFGSVISISQEGDPVDLGGPGGGGTDYTSVPEPSTIGILGFALMGLGLIRRRRSA